MRHRSRSCSVRTPPLALLPLALLPLSLLPLALLLAACGGNDDVDIAETGGTETTDTETSDTTSPTDGTIPEGVVPGGLPGDVFVIVEHVGGFVPVDFQFTNVPNAVVYADGTVVAPGAVAAIFPGPAVGPLFTGSIGEAGVADLLAAAADAGLLAEVAPDPGTDGRIADATTTRITVVVDGRDLVVEAYALAEAGGIGGDPQLTDEQVAVRDDLAAFVAAVDEAALAATEPFEPTGYRVLAREATGDPGESAPNELTWPAGLTEPSLEECLALTGGDAITFVAALEQATQITRWTLAGGQVTLAVRPMLPHESSC